MLLVEGTMKHFDEPSTNTSAAVGAPACVPGAIHVHVIRVTSELPAQPVEMVETTVAGLANVLAGIGVGVDEPATVVVEEVEDSRMIRLSAADQRAFAEALLNPPDLAPALKRAIDRYRATVQKSDC